MEVMLDGKVFEVPVDEGQLDLEMVRPSFNYLFFSFSLLFKMKFLFFIHDYTSIEELVDSHQSFQEMILTLLVREKERQRQIGDIKRT